MFITSDRHKQQPCMSSDRHKHMALYKVDYYYYCYFIPSVGIFPRDLRRKNWRKN